jgi:hypothetical protein
MKIQVRTLLLFSTVVLAWGFFSSLRAQGLGIEAGAHVALQRSPELGERLTGYGFRFTFGGPLPFVALDSELNIFPTSATGNLGEKQLFVGLRAGAHVGRLGIFAKAQPGVVIFGGGGFPQRITSGTHFALNIGGVLEYNILPLIALRLDVGDVLTEFGGTRLVSGPGRVGVPLGAEHDLETTIGAVFRF